MSLRGIGRLTNNYGSDPGIATYSDGFYTASNVEAGKRPIHTERIEVLRGPQGTLYGRNSIGGALNMISKRPTDTWQGEVRAVAGNYDTQIFDGSLSGPITDWLRFKVSGSTGGQGEGFFRDEDGGPSEGNVGDDLYVEGQLEFNIGEAVDGWFKYGHSEWDQRRRSVSAITPEDISPRYFGGLFPTTTFNGPQAPSRRRGAGLSRRDCRTSQSRRRRTRRPILRCAIERLFNTDTPFQTNLDGVHIYTLELIWHTGFADVKYVGGYQGYTYTQESDFDDDLARRPYTVLSSGRGRSGAGTADDPFTIFPQVRAFYQEDKEYYSNEINLISTHDGPFQWILGLYQYHEQVYQFAGVNAPNQPQLDQPRASAASVHRQPRLPARRIPTGSCRTPAHGSMPMRTPCSARSTTASATLEDDDRCALHGGSQGRRGIPHARSVWLRHAYPGAPSATNPFAACGPVCRSRSTARSIAATCCRRMERDDRHRRPRVDAERRHADVREVHARLQERRLQRRQLRGRPHRLHRAGVHQLVRVRHQADDRRAAHRQRLAVLLRLRGCSVALDGARPGLQHQSDALLQCGRRDVDGRRGRGQLGGDGRLQPVPQLRVSRHRDQGRSLLRRRRRYGLQRRADLAARAPVRARSASAIRSGSASTADVCRARRRTRWRSTRTTPGTRRPAT